MPPISDSAKRQGFLSLPFLRDLLLIALIAVVAWKLLSADVKIDLANFSFNDFLALVLALFSVALSVAFYFKANEASNQFYDNTYKFTKDMSEILGRIEAGFGERLRHLDEGYSGMRDRLDKLPHYGATPSDVKKEEEEIRLKEAEQRQLIEELAGKAKLAEHEKKALFENLSQKSHELEEARVELRRMQESSFHNVGEMSERRGVISYIARQLHKVMPSEEIGGNIPSRRIRQLFMENRSNFADAAIVDMRNFGLLNSKDDLTLEAMQLLQYELKRA